MWEVYEDGSYLAHFQKEEEAKAFCEERNWEYEDPEYGFVSSLTYHKVDRIDDAREYQGNKEAVTVDGRLYEPTGYMAAYDGKWHYEFVAEGKREYLDASKYAQMRGGR